MVFSNAIIQNYRLAKGEGEDDISFNILKEKATILDRLEKESGLELKLVTHSIDDLDIFHIYYKGQAKKPIYPNILSHLKKKGLALVAPECGESSIYQGFVCVNLTYKGNAVQVKLRIRPKK